MFKQMVACLFSVNKECLHNIYKQFLINPNIHNVPKVFWQWIINLKTWQQKSLFGRCARGKESVCLLQLNCAFWINPVLVHDCVIVFKVWIILFWLVFTFSPSKLVDSIKIATVICQGLATLSQMLLTFKNQKGTLSYALRYTLFSRIRTLC